MPHLDMNANGGHRDGQHPDEGLLHEWLDDQLSPVDAAEVQAHIAECAACGARVAEARGLIAASHRILSALDEVPSGVIPTHFNVADSAAPLIARADTDGVISIDKTRATDRIVAPTRAFRWQRVAPLAALLLVAVTLARSGFRKDDAFKREQSQAASAISAPMAAPASVVARDSAAPADAADRVALARGLAQQPEAARLAALRESAAPTADAAGAKTKAATTSKPQQVASAKSEARASANASAKKLSESIVAEAAAVRVVPPTSALAAPPTPMVAAAPPPVVVEQAAVRADVLSGRVAGGGGGRGGRGGGRGATEPPPLGASVTAMGSVSNAPASAATAGPPPMTAPLATLPVAAARDSSARRAEPETAQRALAQGQRATDRVDSTTARSTLQLRGFGNASAVDARAASGSATATAAAFDSVTLERTECSPACESTALHISASGVVRFVVGSGNTQRVVMSQLSTPERVQLQALMTQYFPSAVLQRGRTVCSPLPATRERTNARDTAPEVQLLLDMPVGATLRPEQLCAKSATELRDIGARVDAIAGTDVLKRRMPPRE